MAIKTSWIISLKALRRNKMQTALTMIGMTIGVATVLTMIALGSGAESAIQDQVRAAGMNLIVVKAGNYQLQQEAAPMTPSSPAHTILRPAAALRAEPTPPGPRACGPTSSMTKMIRWRSMIIQPPGRDSATLRPAWVRHATLTIADTGCYPQDDWRAVRLGRHPR